MRAATAAERGPHEQRVGRRLHGAAAQQADAESDGAEQAGERHRQGDRHERRARAGEDARAGPECGVDDIRVGADEHGLHRREDDEQVEPGPAVVLLPHPQREKGPVPAQDRDADGGSEQPGERQQLAPHGPGAILLATADQAAQARHRRPCREHVDPDGRTRGVAGEHVGRDDGGRHDPAENDHVAGEQQLGDRLAHGEPRAHRQEGHDVGTPGARHPEPVHVAPGEQPEQQAGDHGDDYLRSPKARESEARAYRQDREEPGQHVQARLQPHAPITEVHAAQHGLGDAGDQGKEEAHEQQRGHGADAGTQLGRDLGDGRGDPDQDGAGGGDERQEQYPDEQRGADGATLQRIVLDRLAARDDEPQRFGGPAVGRAHVGDEAVEHLPHPEQGASQPGHDDGGDDEPHAELRAVVEERLDGVERRPPGQRGRARCAERGGFSRHRCCAPRWRPAAPPCVRSARRRWRA